MTNTNQHPEKKHQQLEKIRQQPGFIAALDQSGGSTLKALTSYGVDSSSYDNDDEIFGAMLDSSIESIFLASKT